MKLSELQRALNECSERAGDYDPDIEIWFKKSMYSIMSIGQFGVVPDVTITIGEKLFSADDGGEG